jgi:hypothetical protein
MTYLTEKHRLKEAARRVKAADEAHEQKMREIMEYSPHSLEFARGIAMENKDAVISSAVRKWRNKE